MRKTVPLAFVGVLALAGCASAGDPGASSAPAAPESQTPSATGSAPAAPSATADPQPSEIPDRPYRIEDPALLGTVSLDDVPQGEPLVIWADDERSLLHVFGAGSSTTACQPTGESIEVDDGVLEIDFEWEDTDEQVVCTADIAVFGWAFPVAASDANASIAQAHVDEWTDDADEITVEVRARVGAR